MGLHEKSIIQVIRADNLNDLLDIDDVIENIMSSQK